MQIDITRAENKLGVKISGRLDSSNASELEREINSKLDGITALTFDFEELFYVSSAGLRVILACQKKMKAVQGTMTIWNPNELVMDIFEATGLADILDIQQAE